jgi:hypothetical protein
MANRQELEQALDEGWTIQVGDRLLRGREMRKELPPDSSGAALEGILLRDPEGRLTREGMEAIIKGGGSVMHGGEPVTDLDALPTAADLARGDERRAQQERSRLLGERARIEGELAKLEQPRMQAPGGGPAKAQQDRPQEKTQESAPQGAAPPAGSPGGTSPGAAPSPQVPAPGPPAREGTGGGGRGPRPRPSPAGGPGAGTGGAGEREKPE